MSDCPHLGWQHTSDGSGDGWCAWCEIERLRAEVADQKYLRQIAEGRVERLTAELERYKSALREITGIGPSFDAKGTQSRRIDKIARRALDGEEASDE